MQEFNTDDASLPILGSLSESLSGSLSGSWSGTLLGGLSESLSGRLSGSLSRRLSGSLSRSLSASTMIWVVTGHQYGISAPVSQASFRGETSGRVAKCRLFSQALKRQVNKNTV